MKLLFSAASILVAASSFAMDNLKNVSDVKAAFNAAKGKVRVVTLLSPTCPECVCGRDVVASEILAKEKDSRLAVLNVWIPMLPTDKREAAVTAGKKLGDKRVAQFWDGERELGEAYAKIVKLPKGNKVAWDIYFVYSPDAEWGDAPPAPKYWMHQLGNDDRCLDGAKLLRSVQGNLKNAYVSRTVMTCPDCGHRKTETMPTDRCVIAYECEKCHKAMSPKKGQCCVYCSYGSVKCPSLQG